MSTDHDRAPVLTVEVVPAPLLEGETASGEVAGLSPDIRLMGIGLVPMRLLRPAAELTEFCREDDAELAAVVLPASLRGRMGRLHGAPRGQGDPGARDGGVVAADDDVRSRLANPAKPPWHFANRGEIA